MIANWRMGRGPRQPIDRRTFIRRGAVVAGTLALGRDFWRSALAEPAQPGPGPYGALPEDPAAADENGLILPSGFTSRIVAVSGSAVGPSTYAWHTDPDGGACFAAARGEWIYVSNQEEFVVPGRGGAGAIRFARDGRIIDAYRILDGTYTNCQGGTTPWGTWLSCEEHAHGMVWECDPFRPSLGIARPALGTFTHEAAVVDPETVGCT